MIHLKFDQYYAIENEVILLRPITQEDFDNLLYFAIQEPEIWQHSLFPPNSKENLIRYINSAIKAREKEDSYPFIIYDKRTNRYAGCTRFYDIKVFHKTAGIGYTWYGKNFQGTGLNKHCKFLLLEFAFEQMQVERIEFKVDRNNIRSINALKSIGATPEGILRSNYTIENGRRDSMILSILKNEWFDTVKSILLKKL
ncbi:GNAT family N-acetyltransferase [Aquimarina muelleri]|uniref:GCN5 family acetyltransferase n=2 Tax=Aquimarina muelleri TaxID=279356 RepID=A0A918JUR5_9FLAO|nr:GNAT family protein [Aquimarina muelleri]MCX2762823.1 GNAT family N-acetyltransferase [Aquimarina muelleri]GGX11682.1 GCN5 family acetyltransferase [Aquimarina muelleri]